MGKQDRQPEQFPKRSHVMPLPQHVAPRQTQPTNARRSDGQPQGTGDGKRPIAGSLGSINAPVPDVSHAQPGVTRKAPTIPAYVPGQDSANQPPPSGSPSVALYGQKGS